MPQQLLVIDATALDLLKAIRADQLRINMRLDQVEMKPRPEWFSIKDAATTLDVTPDTIRRRIASGQMQAKGSGKCRLVKLAT